MFLHKENISIIGPNHVDTELEDSNIKGSVWYKTDDGTSFAAPDVALVFSFA